MAPDANKIQISAAVERLFKVKVEKCGPSNFEGKLRRRGRFSGYRSDWKKAYVKLKEGREGAGVRGDLSMPIKTYRPNTPTRRFQTVVSREEITKQTPEKSLVDAARSAPAAATARAAITSRCLGGGAQAGLPR